MIRLKAFKNGKKFSASLTRSILSYILFILFFWIPVKLIDRLIEYYFRKENNSGYPLVTNYNSKYGIIKQTMSKSIYGNPKLISFEEHYFNAPNQYKLWLETIYDDYMDLPSKIPKRNQIFKLYDIYFGKFNNLLNKSEDDVRKSLGIKK